MYAMPERYEDPLREILIPSKRPEGQAAEPPTHRRHEPSFAVLGLFRLRGRRRIPARPTGPYL